MNTILSSIKPDALRKMLLVELRCEIRVEELANFIGDKMRDAFFANEDETISRVTFEAAKAADSALPSVVAERVAPVVEPSNQLGTEEFEASKRFFVGERVRGTAQGRAYITGTVTAIDPMNIHPIRVRIDDGWGVADFRATGLEPIDASPDEPLSKPEPPDDYVEHVIIIPNKGPKLPTIDFEQPKQPTKNAKRKACAEDLHDAVLCANVRKAAKLTIPSDVDPTGLRGLAKRPYETSGGEKLYLTGDMIIAIVRTPEAIPAQASDVVCVRHETCEAPTPARIRHEDCNTIRRLNRDRNYPAGSLAEDTWQDTNGNVRTFSEDEISDVINKRGVYAE